MKTIQQDLKSNNLSLNEATDMAQIIHSGDQYPSLALLHSYSCMPDINELINVNYL